MGMMLRRWRERAIESEHKAEAEKHVAVPEADTAEPKAESDADTAEHEAAAKKPTKLKRAASSEK